MTVIKRQRRQYRRNDKKKGVVRKLISLGVGLRNTIKRGSGVNVIPGEGKSTSILLHPHRGNTRIKEKGREHRGVDAHAHAHSQALHEASVQNNVSSRDTSVVVFLVLGR